MDVEALIREVRKREYLWRKKKTAGRNLNQRKITSEEWGIVAKNLNISKNAAKKKWRSLRDTFLKELKKIPVYSSDDTYNIDENEKPTWVHFNNLLFLLETYKPTQEIIDAQEESVIDIHSSSDSESSFELTIPRATQPPKDNFPTAENTFPSIRKVYTITKDDETHVNAVQVKKETKAVRCADLLVPLPDGPPPLAMISPLATTSSYASSKRVCTFEDNNDLESARPSLPKKIALESDVSASSFKNDEDSGDENENLAFFRSLLPYMNKMDTVQQLRVRMQFQKILLEELCP